MIKKIKTFLIILFLVISITSISYAEPINYKDDWITGYYSNVENFVDNSHWEVDNSFFASHSEWEIKGLYLAYYKAYIESYQEISEDALDHLDTYWEHCDPETWECHGEYSWSSLFIINGYSEVINYYREYYGKKVSPSIISYGQGPPMEVGLLSEGVYYSEFYIEILTAIGETNRYYSQDFAKWVEDFQELEITHGSIAIEKIPTYVFTKWHKLNDGTTPAGMDLTISFNANTGGFSYIIAKMVVQRYATDDNGENLYDEYEIYEGSCEGSDFIRNDYEYGSVESEISLNAITGSINSHFEFGHAGSEESKIIINFVTEEGNYGTIEAPIPINGYFGINISEVPDNAIPVDKIFLKSAADEESFEF